VQDYFVTGTVVSYTPATNELVFTLQSKHIPFPPEQVYNNDDGTGFVLHETLEVSGPLNQVFNYYWIKYVIPSWSSSALYKKGAIVSYDSGQYILTVETPEPTETGDPSLNSGDWTYLPDYTTIVDLTYLKDNFDNYTISGSEVFIVASEGQESLFILTEITSLMVPGNNKNTYNAWFQKDFNTVSASWQITLGCASTPTYPTFQVTTFEDALQQLSMYGCCRIVIPPNNDLSDFLLPPQLPDGTHLVISHETAMNIPPLLLTVVATHDTNISPSTFALQMVTEIVSFVKNNGVWDAYSGF
jgi:hypothetical protein